MLGDKIATTVLPVIDMERAKSFYTDKLGLSAEGEMTGGLMLGAGMGTKVFLYEKPGGTKAEHTVLGFNVSDLEAEMKELREKGVTFEEYNIEEMGVVTEDGIAVMDGIKSAWFKDTEGNIINIVEMA